MDEDLIVIGRLEKMYFRDYTPNDQPIIAKIDTGADTGALHVIFEEINIVNGQEILRYQPFSEEHEIVETSEFQKVNVKSSNGIVQERHVVTTTVEHRNKKYDIELTLADRSEMSYEVIIGRKFLEGKFLVDVSQENI